MELADLIEALSDPAAYPNPADEVQVRQTHISVVFLAGAYAYKIKKPVDLGFVDFTSLDKRRHFCEEEVRLNRRLAPAVYLGVVPLAQTEQGLKWGCQGEVTEWGVKMIRLPEEASLRERLRRDGVEVAMIEAVARRIAAFHACCASGSHIWACGRFEVIARNARENFEQSRSQVGVTVTQAVFDRLQRLTEDALRQLRPLMDRRAQRGVPRDTHGDLRADHIYFFPERQPPDDLVIVDCIEFNEQFRFADPVADMAFLVMDLLFYRRGDLARHFMEAYIRSVGDEEGQALVPFYTAYRAAVRAKVEGMELSEREIPAAERAAALTRAQGHWLLALGQLEQPAQRPCLVLVGGLPGTGKSTLARGLAEQAGFCVVRSDEVRKELAGLSACDRAASAFGEGIYTAEWTDRTYTECLRRAEQLLLEGRRVIVDATFQQEKWRQAALDTAARLAVPTVLQSCQCRAEVVKARLRERTGDASDADWSVYEKATERWEELGASTQSVTREISMDGSQEHAIPRALDILRELLLI